MMCCRFILLFCVFTAASGQATVAFEQEFDSADAQFFEQSVVPILKNHCLKCHAGKTPKGGLQLTSRQAILTGGESGSAVDLNNHGNSPLLQAINYDGYQMPPSGQLSPADIGVLVEWVERGLPWSTTVHEIQYSAESGPPPVNAETKSFWSFQEIQPQQPPDIAFGHNAIDQFLEQKRRNVGVTAMPPAKPRTLIRRMHYDLLGLPPEPDFVQHWTTKISDGATLNQQAVKELIETLLNSPHYGEHWGRHWLDLVRYAETNSYERDGAKPFVWRYRDYVIQAFNDDKPYDQFILEQLAGDELPDVTADSVVATGYYRLGRWDDEPADPKLAFYDDVDDIVTTTSQTFLGLTVNCARCHDHKIDPIPQVDYYRMVAFFRYLRRYGVRSHESVQAASTVEINRPADKATYTKQLNRYENETADAKRRMAQIEKIVLPDFQDVEKQDFAYDMNKVPLVQKRVGRLINQKQFDSYRHQYHRLQKLHSNKPSGLATALCVKEDYSRNRPTFVLTRGNPHAEAQEVQPGFPSVLSPPEPQLLHTPFGAATSGRRLALARWISSSENPLTSRVMVNRIWQFHFGRGIVSTPSDFGFQGSRPTHPELLDWLAEKFIESKWSIKAMHRLILSSAAYQMQSAFIEKNNTADPLNDAYWKFEMRRLSAEEVRDTILWANRSLNSQQMYGPSIYTDIPQAVKAGQSRPGSGWGHSSPEQKARRSIYIHVKRSLLDPLLESFDFADTDQSCPVRFVTTQPTQALSMLNSEFLQQQAAIFAKEIASQPSQADQIATALTRVTQRTPTDHEIRRGLNLISDLQKKHGLTPNQALTYFCLVTLNLNEMIYID